MEVNESELPFPLPKSHSCPPPLSSTASGAPRDLSRGPGRRSRLGTRDDTPAAFDDAPAPAPSSRPARGAGPSGPRRVRRSGVGPVRAGGGSRPGSVSRVRGTGAAVRAVLGPRVPVARVRCGVVSRNFSRVPTYPDRTRHRDCGAASFGREKGVSTEIRPNMPTFHLEASSNLLHVSVP